eukprot:CAMPEP_0119286526 /NCGR_PEP_ID=MMETSP1329-20130426/34002_1 /TAXON_ID=114041 /ORGANISM="Genus nov. species nov., Strain RCC1024" /LENGTH=105 /DNA_ID=CAMNT_0007287263 /DNA_START=198 /DNA_END=511 /DNA_ORIENTATION=-
MASSLAKHRYFTLVCVAAPMDSAAGLATFVRGRALQELGEVGFGRLQPLVRFYDGASRVAVVRVSKRSAKAFPALVKNAARVAATSGSLRSCKPKTRALLRERGV